MYRSDTHNITIDIAGRGTGKTTRLIHAVKDFLDASPTNSASIVTFNHHQYVSIQRKIIDLMPYIHSGRISNIPVRDAGAVMTDKNMVFFDESDIIGHVPIVGNAYYCTTPTGPHSRTTDIIRMMDMHDSYVDRTEEFIGGGIVGHPRLYWPEEFRDEPMWDADSEVEETRELTETTHVDMYLERLGVKC